MFSTKCLFSRWGYPKNQSGSLNHEFDLTTTRNEFLFTWIIISIKNEWEIFLMYWNENDSTFGSAVGINILHVTR